jgi:hypothetical protein
MKHNVRKKVIQSSVVADYLRHMIAMLALKDERHPFLLRPVVLDKGTKNPWNNSGIIKKIQEFLNISVSMERTPTPDFSKIFRVSGQGVEIAELANIESNTMDTHSGIVQIEKILANNGADGVIYSVSIDTEQVLSEHPMIQQLLKYNDQVVKSGKIPAVMKKTYFYDDDSQARLDLYIELMKSGDTTSKQRVKNIIQEIRRNFENNEYNSSVETQIMYYMTMLNYNGSTPFYPYIYGSFIKNEKNNYTKDLCSRKINARDGICRLAKLKGLSVPAQNQLCSLVLMEKLDGDLFSLIQSGMMTNGKMLNFDMTRSMIMQVAIGLMCGHNLFGFVHNDLHTGNIMFKNVNENYIHYKIQNNIYRIPTYGTIYKILDYGRSALSCNRLGNIASDTMTTWYPKDSVKRRDYYNTKTDILMLLSDFEYECAKYLRLNNTALMFHPNQPVLRKVFQFTSCKTENAYKTNCETAAQQRINCESGGDDCGYKYGAELFEQSRMKNYGVPNIYHKIILLLGRQWLVDESMVKDEVIFDVDTTQTNFCDA